MTFLRSRFALAVALATACGRAEEDPNSLLRRQSPPLEAIDHSAVTGGRFAFLRLWGAAGDSMGTYLVDGGAAVVTRGFQAVIEGPSVSPDGARVAYRHMDNLDDQFIIYDAKFDGTDERPALFICCSVVKSPSWSTNGADLIYHAPDGHFLVGVRKTATIYRQHPWRVDPALRVVAAFPAPTVGTTCPASFSSTFDGPVSHASPDRFAFSCANREIMVLDSVGATVRSIYTAPTPAGAERRVDAASWSPDGSRIAFLESRARDDQAVPVFTVKVLNALGGSLQTVTTVPDGGWARWDFATTLSLCWLADGARIVFAVPDGVKQSHVYVVPAAGGAAVRVTSAANVSDISVSCTR